MQPTHATSKRIRQVKTESSATKHEGTTAKTKSGHTSTKMHPLYVTPVRLELTTQ